MQKKKEENEKMNEVKEFKVIKYEEVNDEKRLNFCLKGHYYSVQTELGKNYITVRRKGYDESYTCKLGLDYLMDEYNVKTKAYFNDNKKGKTYGQLFDMYNLKMMCQFIVDDVRLYKKEKKMGKPWKE